jgi:hypothetical protein
MARTKAKAKANGKRKTPQKSKTPMTPSAARKEVLGRITKPIKKAVSQILLQDRLI